MRICIDLDGVLASFRKEHESYQDVLPVAEAAERLRTWRAEGHTVIIYTARNMRTQEGNLGRVMQNIALETLLWLKEHQFEFDEIYFGKPWADIYIDDNALRFISWDQLPADASHLPPSAESGIGNV